MRAELADRDVGALARDWERRGEAPSATAYAEVVRAAGSVNSVSYEARRGPDAPVYRGRVEVNDGRVQLRATDGKVYDLATDPTAPWNLRWGGEVGAFVGKVVTVRAQPSESGRALEVKEFAPGTSDQFAQGRVLVKDDGVYVNVSPDKQVKVMDPKFAALLATWDKTAFILPGRVEYSDELRQWQYLGTPDSVYLLTKLNPGEGIYYADTPFERVYMKAAESLGGVLPNEKMGQRIFVHGRIGENPAPRQIPNRRFFEADWIGDGIPPQWPARSEEIGKQERFSEALTTESPPSAGGLEGAFEPPAQSALRGSKTGRFTRAGQPPIQERWYEGRKLAEGPIDAEGRPHGAWRELSAAPIEGSVNAMGEAPYRYLETLRGEYDHGKRVGIWTQSVEGKPANAWQWDDGRLVANGHLDAQGQPHDAWTLVARDGFRDGGEGIYSHGKKVSRWNWYREDTTDYERVELYHPNGQLAAKGDQHGERGSDGIVRTWRRGEWEFFAPNGSALGKQTYSSARDVDVEQQGALGNGFTWTWEKN